MLHVLVHRPNGPYAVGPFSSYGKALQCAAGLIRHRGDRFSIVTTKPENGYIDHYPYVDRYPVRPVELLDLAEAPARWYVVHHHRPKGPFVVGPFVTYEDAHEEVMADLGLEGSHGPLPADVSIVEAVIENGKIGDCLVRAPRPID